MTTAGIWRAALLAAAVSVVLAACSGVEVKPPPQSEQIGDPKDDRVRRQYGTLLGEDAFVFGTSRRERGNQGSAGVGIGVNAFLWRATLETLDFVPLASADPFGGLIITEWYQPQDAPNERFKLNVLIRDTVLRADAIKVAVFRQIRSPDGSWLDAPVAPETARMIEDKILTRARELRIASVQASQ
jgi:hypothetical protein